MKRLLIFLMLAPALTGQAQTIGLDAIYIAYQPVDHAVGMRADFHLGEARLYTSATRGNRGMYRQYGLKNHAKYTLGLRIPASKPEPGYQCSITAGINYHQVMTDPRYEGPVVAPRIMKPWSFELGTMAELKRFVIGIRTDILRWEPGLDVGIRIFKDKKQ